MNYTDRKIHWERRVTISWIWRSWTTIPDIGDRLGICPAERLDEMAGMDISVEVPTLSQICVALMKANTRLKLT